MVSKHFFMQKGVKKINCVNNTAFVYTILICSFLQNKLYLCMCWFVSLTVNPSNQWLSNLNWHSGTP